MITKEQIGKILAQHTLLLVRNRKGRLTAPFKSQAIRDRVIDHLANSLYLNLNKDELEKQKPQD